MKHLSHEAREELVEALENQPLNYQGQAIEVYSES